MTLSSHCSYIMIMIHSWLCLNFRSQDSRFLQFYNGTNLRADLKGGGHPSRPAHPPLPIQKSPYGHFWPLPYMSSPYGGGIFWTSKYKVSIHLSLLHWFHCRFVLYVQTIFNTIYMSPEYENETFNKTENKFVIQRLKTFISNKYFKQR